MLIDHRKEASYTSVHQQAGAIKRYATLDELAIKNSTDKSSNHHNYCPVYEQYFNHMRYDEFTLLELGTGAYHKTDDGGQGAKTWRDYFEKAQIITIDIVDKSFLNKEDRITFYQGSQIDGSMFEKIFFKHNVPQIVIDDASHNSILTVESFKTIFPMLKNGAIYVIEDVEASYWDNEEFNGGLNNPNSTVNYFKARVDNLNWQHSGMHQMDIKYIHFWDKLIFIMKG